MLIKDMFDIGGIMEPEDKEKNMLTADDCQITGKMVNNRKIILHLKRESDGTEGNIFVKLKDEFEKDFATSKKVFASKKLIGMTLNQFKMFNIEEL